MEIYTVISLRSVVRSSKTKETIYFFFMLLLLKIHIFIINQNIYKQEHAGFIFNVFECMTYFFLYLIKIKEMKKI